MTPFINEDAEYSPLASNVTGSCAGATNVTVRMEMVIQRFGEWYVEKDETQALGDYDGTFDWGGRHVSTGGGITNGFAKATVCFDADGFRHCRESSAYHH